MSNFAARVPLREFGSENRGFIINNFTALLTPSDIVVQSHACLWCQKCGIPTIFALRICGKFVEIDVFVNVYSIQVPDFGVRNCTGTTARTSNKKDQRLFSQAGYLKHSSYLLICVGLILIGILLSSQGLSNFLPFWSYAVLPTE
jgi:hypothetical protein